MRCEISKDIMREYTAMISVRQIYGYVVLHLILKDKDSSRKEDE